MQVERYDIELDIDFKKLTYAGKERITVRGNGEKLLLNSVDINIQSIVSDGKNIPFKINEKSETIETDLTVSGNAAIDLKFDAKVSESLHGFYVARYPGGYMLSTQFESTGARRTFPCIDDPKYKAVFSLRIVIDDDLEAISNMPEIGEDAGSDGKKAIQFADTPVMSTYLLYVGVGKFDHMERDMNGVKGIFSAPRGQLRSTDFPLVEAEKIIGYFEDFYGIKFVLPKLHLISVPEFAAGAMENWGAITFREVLLLVSENTSISVKQAVSEVIAHEIAHQWFGDLVTMEWWNDLWLNESFATFMGYKAVDKLHPDWQMMGRLLLLDTSGALTGDALKNTHPIDADVKSPDDIAQIFDEISYGKGASILRMIEGYVGETNFRDGIRKYLNDHMYGNAKGSDLWSSIEQVSGLPVSRIMEAWIRIEGYPVLKLRNKNGKISITQSRFTLKGYPSDQVWPVPLTVVRKGGVESLLMESREMEIDGKDFIKLNRDQTGFYMVLYDESMMKNINDQIDRISYMDSWGIVHDLFALLRSSDISVDQYLEGLKVFFEDTNYIVSQEISAQLFSLNQFMPGHEKLTSISADYYRKQLKRLGDKKEGEMDNISILRGAVSMYLALIDRGFANELGKKFNQFFSLDPNIRQAVAVGHSISSNSFQDLEKAFSTAESDEDRLYLLHGLSRLTGQENFERLMKLTDSDQIKKQDSLRVYVNVAMNPDQRGRMFSMLGPAVSQVERYFQGTGYTGMMLESVIPYLGLGRLEDMKSFLMNLRGESYKKGIDKGLELLEVYSRMVEKNS